MINSILYCLLGHTGGIFIETEKGFEVNGPLSEAEKESLIPICELGFKYKLLNSIVKSYNKIFNEEYFNANPLNENKFRKINKNSIYLSGVYSSFSQLLSSYRVSVSELENKYYTLRSISVPYIISYMSSYIYIFKAAQEFLSAAYEGSVKGGKMLDLIYRSCLCGDPRVREMFYDTMKEVMRVFNGMISKWIINNVIQNQEFFIASAYTSIDSTKTDKDDNFFIYNDNELQSWTSNFYLIPENFPSFFPHIFFEDILFLGKATKILSSPRASKEARLSFEEISIFSAALRALDTKKTNNKGPVDVELYMKLVGLMKKCVSKNLYTLVVDSNGFMKHLQAVRNIFLTYSGEFYYNFIMKIQDLLNLSNFNKSNENDINELFFKVALKEVFHIDTDKSNYNIYNNFRIKLISSGFSFNFDKKENIRNYIENKDLIFLGGLKYNEDTNCFRIMNTTYKSQNGVIWNTQSFDFDDEFKLSFEFTLKNFTKPESQEEDPETRLFLSPSSSSPHLSILFIFHTAKDFPSQPPISPYSLNRGLIFSIELTEKLKIRVLFVDKRGKKYEKEIEDKEKDINNNNDIENKNFDDKGMIVIYEEEFDKEGKNKLQELIKDGKSDILIEFKDNFCIVRNKENSFKASFPLRTDNFLPKEKRKVLVGTMVVSENMDFILEYHNWNVNFYGGEIYNENSNLILIKYNPPWPHNFIFNNNIIKNYNEIFNLIFPLKTSLTMLNSLWVDKKTICKRYSSLFKVIDSIHASLHLFLQNLISFYMFDVIDVNFCVFFKSLNDYRDLEEIMRSHEQFLNTVIVNSFVKSKKIMRIIFNILFVIRKFYNFVRNILTRIHEQNLMEETGIVEEEEGIREELFKLKGEFRAKVDVFKSILEKIKNTKHHKIVSQILSKLE